MLHPSKYVRDVTDYVVEDEILWNRYAIRVTYIRSLDGRAPWFGVPFQRAANIAIEKGFKKSLFYLPESKDDVFYPALLIHVSRRKKSNNSAMELQAWQYSPGTPEVFYVHAESPDFTEYVSHLDGAIIHFEPHRVR